MGWGVGILQSRRNARRKKATTQQWNTVENSLCVQSSANVEWTIQHRREQDTIYDRLSIRTVGDVTRPRTNHCNRPSASVRIPCARNKFTELPRLVWNRIETNNMCLDMNECVSLGRCYRLLRIAVVVTRIAVYRSGRTNVFLSTFPRMCCLYILDYILRLIITSSAMEWSTFGWMLVLPKHVKIMHCWYDKLRPSFFWNHISSLRAPAPASPCNVAIIVAVIPPGTVRDIFVSVGISANELRQ